MAYTFNLLPPELVTGKEVARAVNIMKTIAIFAVLLFAILAAVIAGFGRVIAELGSALMLGGNIKGYTRTMATAIGLETSKGEFGFAIALGFILITAAFLVNIVIQSIQRMRK